jgi:hypothetical protein
MKKYFLNYKKVRERKIRISNYKIIIYQKRLIDKLQSVQKRDFNCLVYMHEYDVDYFINNIKHRQFILDNFDKYMKGVERSNIYVNKDILTNGISIIADSNDAFLKQIIKIKTLKDERERSKKSIFGKIKKIIKHQCQT